MTISKSGMLVLKKLDEKEKGVVIFGWKLFLYEWHIS